MTNEDIAGLMKGVATVVKDQIALLEARFTERVNAIQTRAGDPGRDGKDANSAEIAADVVDRVMKMLPPPKNGNDGKSVTVDEVKPLLEGEVSRWELEFERRATDLLQRAVDKIPRPKDGLNGFGLDDFSIETKDGGRVLSFKFKQDGRELIRAVKMDVIIDRGLYGPGQVYERGDCMTYGGSLWIAQKTISKPPGDQDPGWRLAVKRGRPGKDAEPGKEDEQ